MEANDAHTQNNNNNGDRKGERIETFCENKRAAEATDGEADNNCASSSSVIITIKYFWCLFQAARIVCMNGRSQMKFK